MKKKKLMMLLLLLMLSMVVSKPAWAGDVYVKVTSSSDLTVGGFYIIAGVTNKGGKTCIATGFDSGVLTGTMEGNNVGFTVNGNIIEVTSASPLVFTLGGNSTGYTLKYNSNYYLGYSGSSNTFEGVTSSSNNKEKWTYMYNDVQSLYAIVNKSSPDRFIGLHDDGYFKVYAKYDVYPIATLYKKVAKVTLATACTDGEKYYGTYSNTSAFVVPSDLTVSEIKVVDSKLSVSNYAIGDVVPKNTGVMVASTTAGNHFVDLTSAAGSSVLGEDNMLKPSGNGITAEGMASGNDGNKFYRLTMHEGTTLGFYWGADNGAAFELAANKAFLAVPSGAGAGSRISGFNFDDQTSGIKTTNNASTMSHETYNLQGQRVKADRKGLIVRNGKIIMNK